MRKQSLKGWQRYELIKPLKVSEASSCGAPRAHAGRVRDVGQEHTKRLSSASIEQLGNCPPLFLPAALVAKTVLEEFALRITLRLCLEIQRCADIIHWPVAVVRNKVWVTILADHGQSLSR